MAAVTLKEGSEFDCVTTFCVLANYLPMYARPRFIRIQVRRPIRALPLTDFLLSSLNTNQCLAEFLGNDRNLQDEESETGGGRLRSSPDPRSALLPGFDSEEIHSTNSGDF